MWVQSLLQVCGEVVEYFKTSYVNPMERSRLDGVPFSRLSTVENNSLIKLFLLDKIEKVVNDNDGNKSLGPNGFNFAFINEFWYVLKNEVRIMSNQFHGNEVVPKCLLSYFVTLVHKVASPFSLKDFQPISLLQNIYKLLSKALVVRLSRVMNYITSSSQTTFLKGRNLVDGVMVVNKVVDFVKKSPSKCI